MQRDLVVRAQLGDHDAFTTLVEASVDRLYAAARLILRDPDRSEDAVQDALIHSWVGIRGLRDPDPRARQQAFERLREGRDSTGD